MHRLLAADASRFLLLGAVGVFLGTTLASAAPNVAPTREQLTPRVDDINKPLSIRGSNVGGRLNGNLYQPGDCVWLIDVIDRLGVRDIWKKGLTTNDATWIAPPGWIVLNHRVVVWGSSEGYHSVSTVAQGMSLINETTVNQQYDQMKAEIDASAESKGVKASLKAKLELDRQNDLNIVRRYQSSHNGIFVKLFAHSSGGPLNRYSAWHHISVSVQVCYVGEPSGSDLLKRLQQKYGKKGQSGTKNQQGLPGTDANARDFQQ